MERRTFIQALGAFLAGAAVLPEVLVGKVWEPVDWYRWNHIEIKAVGGEVVGLRINGEDRTWDMEARRKLGEMVRVDDDRVRFGGSHGSMAFLRMPESLPETLYLTFAVHVNREPGGWDLDSFVMERTSWISGHQSVKS